MENPCVRRIRDAADAANCLAQVETSGLPLREWAWKAGVDARSLNIWRVNQQRKEPSVAPLRMVELVTMLETPPCLPRSAISVRCLDLRIDVAPDFDEATLIRLLRVLRAC